MSSRRMALLYTSIAKLLYLLEVAFQSVWLMTRGTWLQETKAAVADEHCIRAAVIDDPSSV